MTDPVNILSLGSTKRNEPQRCYQCGKSLGGVRVYSYCYCAECVERIAKTHTVKDNPIP